jgi:hypothetical protein
MSVITSAKGYDEVYALVARRGDLPLVVLGCNKCAKTSGTGGAEQVQEMRRRLRESNLLLREPAGLPDAVDEGLCDPQAVRERAGPLTAEPTSSSKRALGGLQKKETTHA